MCPRAWIRARMRAHAHARARTRDGVGQRLGRVHAQARVAFARARDGRALANLGSSEVPMDARDHDESAQARVHVRARDRGVCARGRVLQLPLSQPCRCRLLYRLCRHGR